MYDDSMYDGVSTGISFAIIMIWIISIAISITVIIGYWKIFTKAGHAGWKSLIPILNVWTLFEIAWGTGIMCLLLFVPAVDIVILLMVQFKLARAFGKSDGFALGLFFLPYIFYPILGFGDSEYIGPDGQIGQTVVINQYNYNYGDNVDPEKVPNVQINPGGNPAAASGVQVNGAGAGEPAVRRRPHVEPESERDYKFCGHCGAKISKTAKFCRQCGSPVASSKQIEEYKLPSLEEEVFQEQKLQEPENQPYVEPEPYVEPMQDNHKLEETIITDKSRLNIEQNEPTDDLSAGVSDDTDDLSDLQDDVTELLVGEPVNIGPVLRMTEICDKEEEGEAFSVSSTPYVIGRAEDMDHIVESRGVSKKHMQIDFEDGVYYATDLNSTNGVTLNDEKIAPMDRVEIHQGDVIKIGLKEFIVEIES